MPETESPKKAASSDAGQAQVQKFFDQVNEKGYIGQNPDPTPQENYSLKTPPDAPTPETDEDLFHEARASAIGNARSNLDLNSAEAAAAKKKG
jgi:hypothetical protein